MPIFVYNPALVVIILSELVVASFINKNDTFCENPATYRLFPMKRITSRLARSIIFFVETKKVFLDFFKSKLCTSTMSKNEVRLYLKIEEC